MQIFVRLMPHGPTYPLEVEPSDAVFSVKTQVHAQTGIPIPSQLLRYAGQDLQDNLLMSDYNIQREALLHLFVRPALAAAGVYTNHVQLDAGWLVTGITYVVERSTNLLADGSWTPIASFAATSATQRLTDSDSSSRKSLFYRLSYSTP